jgi:hypothetical protein
MGGRVVHFEMPFDSEARARSFYSTVFGWAMVPVEGQDYLLATTGPTPADGPPTEPGFINGGLVGRDESIGHVPAVVIDVEDIDATLEQIERLGGRPLREKEPVGEMGFTAYFEDPEGNIVGLWETAVGSAQPSS